MKLKGLNSSEQLKDFSETFSIFTHAKNYQKTIQTLQNPSEKNKAMGYGCGKCKCKIYSQVVNGWQCNECGTVFPIIGGSKGPRYCF